MKLTATSVGAPRLLSNPHHHPAVCRDEERQFQLYESDPSGNYGGWKATAIGAGHQGATNLLKQDYKDDITLQAAVKLVIQARAAAM